MTDLMSTFTLPQLIDLALAPLLSQLGAPMAISAVQAHIHVPVRLETLEPAPVAQAVAQEAVPAPVKVLKARAPRKTEPALAAPTRTSRPARSTPKTQAAPTSA